MRGADVPPYGLGTLQLNHIPPSLVPCLFTIALAVAPLSAWTLFTLRARDLVDPGRLVGWALGLVALGYVTKWDLSAVPTVTLRNYVTPTGSFSGVAVGYAPPIMDGALAHHSDHRDRVSRRADRRARRPGAAPGPSRRFARSGRSVPVVLTLYSLMLVAFVVGLSFGGQVQFDRYLYPLFFGAGLVLLRPSRRRSLSRPGWVLRVPFALVAVASVVFLAAVGLNMTASTDARDGAIWRPPAS